MVKYIRDKGYSWATGETHINAFVDGEIIATIIKGREVTLRLEGPNKDTRCSSIATAKTVLMAYLDLSDLRKISHSNPKGE